MWKLGEYAICIMGIGGMDAPVCVSELSIMKNLQINEHLIFLNMSLSYPSGQIAVSIITSVHGEHLYIAQDTNGRLLGIYDSNGRTITYYQNGAVRYGINSATARSASPRPGQRGG